MFDSDNERTDGRSITAVKHSRGVNIPRKGTREVFPDCAPEDDTFAD